ncbi:G-protein coupled receptor GRL101-like [Actinia tenebrosa]|uniref:G-protein coupled receptor GRL101-like n=1 Tax=Actinia tenebrosa TaxID=6105 RepID=A0A6P8J330_ACTTE|nr:G-protein coupled receptor GRL101-like [Actinia tenebrosa]
MLKSIYVQICMWIEGVFATLGNLAVILWWTLLFKRQRKSRRKMNRVQSLLFCHLAFADLLMGVYLLFIGTYNEIWKGEYFLHDVEWRAGVKCKIAGAIATLSSEVSVMLLAAITADRMNTILFNFSARRISFKLAHVLCLFIWVIGFIMSFTPLLVPSYFNDKISGFNFYGCSTVCLSLQLSTDRPAGWEYSVAVFIGFNGAVFFFILVGYIAIFVKVRKSGRKVRKSSNNAESSLGKRVFFVILTDFCCWMPIMVLGVLSLMGKFNDPSVYICVGVFVLPVNSAINPVLYTFSSSQTINNIRSLRRKWLKDKGVIRLEGKYLFRKRKSDQSSSAVTTASTPLRTNDEAAGLQSEAKIYEPDKGPSSAERQMLVIAERQLLVKVDDEEKKSIMRLLLMTRSQP